MDFASGDTSMTVRTIGYSEDAMAQNNRFTGVLNGRAIISEISFYN